MIRFALTAALLLATASHAVAIEPLSPPVPRLKDTVIVSAEVVLIGDLIDNAGPASSIAVFRAPDLGEIGAVEVSRIAAALRPHHIVRIDTRGLHEVTVMRLSRIIPAAEFEDRLLHAVAGRYGLGDVRNLSLALDRPLHAVHVEAALIAELAVTRLNIDPRSGRFDAVFELAGSTARRLPLRVTGTVSETVEVAVLTRTLARGDVIKAADFTVERRRKAEFLASAMPASQAVGLAAVRPLRMGELLRTTDLTKAEVVRRNQTVTIVYQAPGITLTVRGKALESGAVGDVINVTNLQSNHVVQASVEGPGRVAIAAMAPAVVLASAPAAPPVEPPATVPEPPSTSAPPAPPPSVLQLPPAAPSLPLPSVSLSHTP